MVILMSIFREHIFRMYDSNLDGVIDFQEFLTTTHVMSWGTAEENLHCIFRFLDIDRNGFLEREELMTVARDLLVENEKIIDGAFEEMDMNEEGKVSVEDFTKACFHKKPNVIKLTMNVMKVFLES